MNSSDETFSLETFTWHLAAHLCGAQALHQHPQDPSGFRLYWRSSPLLCPNSSGSSGGTKNSETKKSCAFVDATFEFACWNKEEEEEEPNDETTPLIRMHWGSLWLLEPNSTSATGASYYTGQAVTVQDLDHHFAAFAIDLDSTPAAVLAKQMAKALQGLSSSSVQEERISNSSLSISLFYADFQQSAPLELVPAAPVETRPHSCSPVDKALLQMLLLQHSSLARQQSTRPDEVTEQDLAQLSNYIENEWKPLFRRRSCPSEPETQTTTAAATASPPPPAASLDETDNNAKTDSAKKKKVPGGASRKPVSFQPKGRQHGTAQIGGHRKKQKKNYNKEGGMAGLFG